MLVILFSSGRTSHWHSRQALSLTHPSAAVVRLAPNPAAKQFKSCLLSCVSSLTWLLCHRDLLHAPISLRKRVSFSRSSCLASNETKTLEYRYSYISHFYCKVQDTSFLTNGKEWKSVSTMSLCCSFHIFIPSQSWYKNYWLSLFWKMCVCILNFHTVLSNFLRSINRFFFMEYFQLWKNTTRI